MKQAHGKFCGDFKQPKVPFKPQPFFGKYARMHVAEKPGPAAQSKDQKNGAGKGNNDKSGGGTKFPPDAYESPPQQTPTTQQPQGGDQQGTGGQDGGIAPAPG